MKQSNAAAKMVIFSPQLVHDKAEMYLPPTKRHSAFKRSTSPHIADRLLAKKGDKS